MTLSVMRRLTLHSGHGHLSWNLHRIHARSTILHGMLNVRRAAGSMIRRDCSIRRLPHLRLPKELVLVFWQLVELFNILGRRPVYLLLEGLLDGYSCAFLWCIALTINLGILFTRLDRLEIFKLPGYRLAGNTIVIASFRFSKQVDSRACHGRDGTRDRMAARAGHSRGATDRRAGLELSSHRVGSELGHVRIEFESSSRGRSPRITRLVWTGKGHTARV